MRGGGGIEGGSKIDARSINSATLYEFNRPSAIIVPRFEDVVLYEGGEGRQRYREIARRVVVHRPARRRPLTDFSVFEKVLLKKEKEEKRRAEKGKKWFKRR